MIDRGLAGALARLFAGRSVAGLGDGRGEYRRLILSTGLTTHYDAYDGAPNIYNITGGQVTISLLRLLWAGIVLVVVSACVQVQ